MSRPACCRVCDTPLTVDLAGVLNCPRCRKAIDHAQPPSLMADKVRRDLEVALGPQERI